MDFQTLRPLILTKLQGISALYTAKDVHTEVTTGYPYATFEPSKLESSFLTNTDNLREYTFDIIVYHEMTKAGRDTAVGNLCLAVDAIITAFDTDTTLRTSGGAHYVNALPAEWGEYVNKAGPVKFARCVLTIGGEVQVL